MRVRELRCTQRTTGYRWYRRRHYMFTCPVPYRYCPNFRTGAAKPFASLSTKQPVVVVAREVVLAKLFNVVSAIVAICDGVECVATCSTLIGVRVESQPWPCCRASLEGGTVSVGRAPSVKPAGS